MSRVIDSRLQRLADYFLNCGSRSDVDPLTIPPDLLPLVYILQIEPLPGDVAAVENPGPSVRLRVRLAGTAIDAALGRSTKGACLDDFMHGPRGAEVLAQFHACAETRAPVWMQQIVRMPQRPARLVEGIAVWLQPGYLYGGLIFQEHHADMDRDAHFECAPLR